MATTTTKLMTFAEFEQLPNTPEGFPFELRHGELVKLVFPKMKHSRVQWQLRRLLERAAGQAGIVEKEVGFRPTCSACSPTCSTTSLNRRGETQMPSQPSPNRPARRTAASDRPPTVIGIGGEGAGSI